MLGTRIGVGQLLLIVPVHALVFAIILIPGIWIFWMSLHEWTLGMKPQFIGLSNYTFVLTDPYFWRAFINTFVVVNVVVYVELALALGMAVLFVRGVPFPRFAMAVILAPYAVTEVIAVIMWKYMMEPNFGIVSQLLAMTGVPELAWSTHRWAALSLISLISIWLHLPFSFLLLYSGLLGIPKDFYESSAIDGASRWQQLRRITVPLLMPTILVALMFRYIFGFRIFGEVWILTGGGPARQTEVLATYLYRHAFAYQDFGIGAAIGWLMAIASLVIASAYLYQMYRSTAHA